ncbi:hypothetical protein JRO89_XS05G0085700 [Xanthoceras sorbifolium]|uniref:Gnk2-homologous domain-containing protein n=1 Tax=Xanthoceras sorbifolium TaxID=99658 RepID=A0ABQ8I124_9ROSI|nr:hypothetical protein JRO89_XS05G0085700 [Xanthoceras sorbifolium]
MCNSLLFVLLLFSFFAKPSLCDPRATQAAIICSNRTSSPPQRQIYIANFLATMDVVTPVIARQRYAAVVNGTGNTTVYTYGECMKDLSPNDCDLCFAQCKTQILRCLPFQLATRGGRLFYDGCYLRYDDYEFFNETLSSKDTTVCGKNEFGGGNKTVFGANAIELVRNLSVQAVKNDGFFVGSVSRGNVSVFGLAQCWEPVNGIACEDCLSNAVSRISSCTPMEEGRALNAGCYLRYSTQRFYNNSQPDPLPNNGGGSNKLAIILGTTSAVAFLLIVGAAVFFVNTKLVRKRRERKQLGSLLATVNKSKLNFSYETLERATNYFHDSNKLGQGGSGSVYKGILPDGKTVAIKRLFFNTRQWAQKAFLFTNSCQIRAYMTAFLVAFSSMNPFSHVSVPCALKVILLGTENSEFSVAWYFHLQGYMAPEYVVRGKLTEKADVYSFGVVVFEVVCGKKNNSFTESSSSILQMVWDLYGRRRLHEAVDPVLQSNFQEEEASRLLRIGLLCVQASAELRPSMSMVVKMLKDNHEIPEPTQPPFLNPSSTEISRPITPTSTNSKPESYSQSSGNSRNNMTQSWIEPR